MSVVSMFTSALWDLNKRESEWESVLNTLIGDFESVDKIRSISASENKDSDAWDCVEVRSVPQPDTTNIAAKANMQILPAILFFKPDFFILFYVSVWLTSSSHVF
jgi:hypothetical protein